MFRSEARLLIVRGLALLGVITALVRLWGFALSQNSLMDEGEYLLKGHFFVTGQYWPFQDYGLWTNQMPFAFLIPGWVQMIFGVGIRTGRGYALVLNALILIGLWFLIRRIVRFFQQEKMGEREFSPLLGEYLAAGGIWAYALNSATLKIYSSATSQVLITCMLMSILLLILGGDRPLWYLVLGGILGGLMLMTRLNLAPALPLMIGYIFWQHGKRAGVWATVAMAITIGVGHAIFWPGILRAWAAWAPSPLSDLLIPWRPPEGISFWNPEGTLDGRVLSFLFMLRYHYVAFLGALCAMIWGWQWKEPGQRRVLFFLTTLFFVLLAAHAWASLGIHEQTDNALGNDYCIFCFPIYTAFFSILGILLGVMWLASRPWMENDTKNHLANRLQNGLAFMIALLFPVGVGYGAFQDVGDAMSRWRIPRLKTLVSSGEAIPGVPLWDFLDTRFQIGFELSKRLLPTLAGLVLGLFVLFLAIWLSRRMNKGIGGASSGGITLTVLMALGMLISPTVVLGAGYSNYDCTGDVIAAYENAGAHMANLIPAHSTVYWQGTLSAAPLLYLDEPQILPGQINLDYTLRLSGSDDAHLRFGFWTNTLAQDWLAEADYAIVAKRYYQGWLREALEVPNHFVELPRTMPLAPCDENSYLRVFENIR